VGGRGQEPEWPDPSENTAPKDVAVHREEIFERIKHERSPAGNT
jgi:hypothetical protein